MNGEYTYVRDPGSTQAGSEVFTYTIVDGDGDTTTATLTLAIPNINTLPSIVSADDTVVDEDTGLKNANADTNPSAGAIRMEPISTGATTAGQIGVDFKSDVPANLANAITLLSRPALDGHSEDPRRADIVFMLESGVLVWPSEGGGRPLVEISITGVMSGPGAGQADLSTYEVDLSRAGPASDPNSEDTVSLNGVSFLILSDSNNDHATGTFDVHIVDDVPTAAVSDRGVPGITLDESAVAARGRARRCGYRISWGLTGAMRAIWISRK